MYFEVKSIALRMCTLFFGYWKDIVDYRRQMIKETLITVIDNAEVCKNTSVQT